jgi:hypothetical protein
MVCRIVKTYRVEKTIKEFRNHSDKKNVVYIVPHLSFYTTCILIHILLVQNHILFQYLLPPTFPIYYPDIILCVYIYIYCY